MAAVCVIALFVLLLLSSQENITSFKEDVHSGHKRMFWEMFDTNLNAFSAFPSLFVWQKCLELKSSLLAQQKGTQSSLERLRTLIRLIQNEQMIQVTMTTTTTSSLLTMPWIKPSSASAAMHQTLQHSQGHNWPGRHRTAMEGGQTLHPGTKRKGTDAEGKSGLGVYTHCNLQARRSHL